jgi:uncharacterized repeat protein (TIGR03803 family)
MKYRGVFYGATLNGGTYSDGTIFAVTPSGKEVVLHSFGASGDGQNPYTTLFAHLGVLYGTAVNGGAYGGGTIFTITASGTEATLYSFGGVSGDGVSPRGVPIAVGGELYGTTEFGGAYGQGTIYEITTGGQEQVLHSFGGSDAEDPTDGLYYYKRAFYGTGYQGGADAEGAVFKMDRSGKERVLHSFTGGSDGAHPWGTLVLANGALYGTASLGGSSGIGTIFRVTP